MAVSITDASGKNVKVAGRGISGKSAYDYAVDGGYTGTEEEFQALLGSGPWVAEAGYVPASNQNLLDNWYFPDPINQRNTASGELWAGYFFGIDRWMSFGSDVTKWIRHEGICLCHGINSIIEQHIEPDRIISGETHTLSALVNNQLITASFVAQKGNFFLKYFQVGNGQVLLQFDYDSQSLGVCNARIWNSSNNTNNNNDVLVIAAKLERGPVQTLAHKNASGNWILNDHPPNKAAELAKCQKYLVPLTLSWDAGIPAMNSQILRYSFLPPLVFADSPALILPGTITIATPSALTVTNPVFAIAGKRIGNMYYISNFTLRGDNVNGLEFGKTYQVYPLPLLSCEL